jgi:glutaminyl-tRNA synthetase
MIVNENGIEEPMRFQFERMGYFCTDRDSTPGHLVFNRSCSLKDTWAKLADQK